MPRRLKKADFKDSQKLEKITNPTTTIKAGKRVSTSKSSNGYQIQRGIELFTKAKTMRIQNKGASSMDSTLCVLSNFGCSLSHEGVDFSLLTNQTDTEQINNENIMPDFNAIGCPQPIDMQKSFKNINDSFYTLDDRRPRREQEAFRQEQDTMNNNPSLLDSVAGTLMGAEQFSNLEESSYDTESFNQINMQDY